MRFCSKLLTLSLIICINEAKQTQLMESLQCLNDYKSFVSCTWSEHRDVQKFVKMNLFYKTKTSGGFKQMTTCSSLSTDFQHWKCYRNQSYFGVLDEEYYTFKPDRKLQVQLNVSLFGNVQPLPPKKLNITVTEEGNFLLTWKAGGERNGSHWLDESLDYQVAYKRDWEPWERSTSVFVSNASRFLLYYTDLVTGSAYVARVRSKLRQDSHHSGHYSEWSSAVKWTVMEGDEAQPKNLRCLFNGLDRLNCMWEVRRELTGSLAFALYYKISPESIETPCSPVEEKELPDNLHILQSCEINVTNPGRLSQYLITVQPREDEKIIEPVSNIKADPPYGLSVTKSKNQLYKLQWKDKKHENLRIYQVLYWEADKIPETAQLQNISDDVSQFTFKFKSLEPGTHYKARMRAKVRYGIIDSPWSMWSGEYEWVTESELPFWSFTLAVPFFIILAIVGLYCSKRYLLRKKREWERSIPRPPSMFLLPNYFKQVQLSDSFEESNRQSSLEEEDVNSSSTSDRPMLVRCSDTLGAEPGKTRPFSSAFQNRETATLSDAKLDEHMSPTELFPSVVHSHSASLAQQVFDFNGPYLMPLQKSPVPDGQEVGAPLEARETQVSMQYVELPHGPCSQVVPVGKETGTIPPLCTAYSEQEEKQPLSGRREEVSEGHLANGILERGGDNGQRPQSRTITNSHTKNGILDYFTTEDLSRNTETGSSFMLPNVALKEGVLSCVTTETSASQRSQTTDSPSSSELYQKETDTVLPSEDQAPTVLSVKSQDVFSDYVTSLPGSLGSMPKERDALSPKDPGCNKNFLVFNPDGKSPIFLSQVGDYCFFPTTKPITKTEEGYIGHQLAEDSHSLTKQPCENRFVESELQTTPQICHV